MAQTINDNFGLKEGLMTTVPPTSLSPPAAALSRLSPVYLSSPASLLSKADRRRSTAAGESNRHSRRSSRTAQQSARCSLAATYPLCPSFERAETVLALPNNRGRVS